MEDKFRTIYANLSDQAKIALWISSFTWIVVNFLIIYFFETRTEERLLSWNLSILFFIYNVYTIDCSVKGNCEFLAYFQTAVMFLQSLVILYPLTVIKIENATHFKKTYPF